MLPALLAAALASTTAPLAVPQMEGPSAGQPRRIEPIGGYTLALLWTPEHCRHAVPGAEALACGPATGSGFVLHGLWPDGVGKSWPQWCRPTAILPPRILAAYYRATPSTQLLQHEWAKHGTCMRIGANGYFKRSTRLFFALHDPDMPALAAAGPIDAGTVARAFAAANPGYPADAVNLNLDPEGWLRELWLCLDTRFRPEPCKAPVARDRPVRIRLPG